MKYHITMNKDDFFKVHKKIVATNVTIILDDVNFDCDYKSFGILKGTGYDYKLEGAIKDKVIGVIKKYHFIFLGLLFMLSVIYINTYRYENIIFNIESPINDELENDIKKRTKRLLFFDFLSLDYKQYSNNLRINYPEYPYIEVYHKANNVYIDIYNYDDTIKLETNVAGDIVSKYDGVIDLFYIYQGKNMVSKNKYVKEGEVLVSSLINETNIQASGLIIGYTYQKIVVDIDKEQKKEGQTGNSSSFYNISLVDFNFDISKDANYNLYDEKKEEIFNLFSFFSITKCIQSEKYDIIKKNTLEDAINEAKTQISDEFERKRVSNLEKIDDLILYNSKENESTYTLTFIAKKYVSFGEFRVI